VNRVRGSGFVAPIGITCRVDRIGGGVQIFLFEIFAGERRRSFASFDRLRLSEESSDRSLVIRFIRSSSRSNKNSSRVTSGVVAGIVAFLAAEALVVEGAIDEVGQELVASRNLSPSLGGRHAASNSLRGSTGSFPRGQGTL